MGERTRLETNEVAASIVLLLATLAALIIVNSPFASYYKDLMTTPVSVRIDGFIIEDPLKHWIKNALMAVFFLLVGLELKSEFKEGALSTRKSAVLPFIAAAAGMIVPAIIYLVLVKGDVELARGWAIPCATDIAFAVGIIGLIGSRVPPGLKALLLAIAVIDDLGSILVIALFYTEEINTLAVWLSLACIALLAGLNYAHENRIWPYMLLGVALWLCLMKSGINATLAGVVAALFVPLHGKEGSPLHNLADAIKWTVLFIIMPVFAFANAGVALGGLELSTFAEPLTSGIALGLFIGKPLGIVLAILLAVRFGVSALPAGVNWGQIVGMGFIAGIGFTMSLFIGALAFEDEAMMDKVRLGVLSGSLVAALIGTALLLIFAHRTPLDWAERLRAAFRREIF